LQYRPNSDLSIGFDALYGKLDIDRDEYHLANNGSNSTALGCAGPDYDNGAGYVCSQLNDIEYNANNEVVYSSFSNTNIQSENRNQTADSEITQFVLNADWTVSSDLTLSALAGTMKSTYQDNSAKVYLESFGDETIDFTQDRFYGQNSYSGLKVGMSYKKFEHSDNYLQTDNLLLDDWQSGAVSDVVNPDYVFVNNQHSQQAWLSTDVNSVLAAYGIDRNGDMVRTPNKVEEETKAAYVLYDLSLFLGDTELRANAGVRYYQTDIASAGLFNQTEYVTLESDYDGYLPTMNLAWYATDNLVLRASAGKNLTRPTLNNLAVGGSINTDPQAGASGLSISAGNAALQPFETVNMEAGVEYYFDEVGYMAVSYFRKDIENFISTTTTPTAYGETGYPLELIDSAVDADGNPQTADTLYDVYQPQNLQRR